MSIKIGFIGGGNMAASMIGGLSGSGSKDALIATNNIWVYDTNQQCLNDLQVKYKINCANNNKHLIQECNVVVIALKPQVLKSAVDPIANQLLNKKPLLISVVAGIRCETIERWLGGEVALVRAMPNTPALIGLGASGLFANKRVNDVQKALADKLLASVGITLWLDKQSDLNLVTALSGSGPAYFMLFIKSLIDAAVDAGLDEQNAKRLALQTAVGASEMIKKSNATIGQLIENVTSPNGTTEQALKSFHDAQLPAIVATAFDAAKIRSEQLAIDFDV